MKSINQSKGYNQTLKYAQDELALQYLPAVKAMAFRLKERLPSSIEMADLVSIGTEELIKLARRYDSSLNDSFWGFAKTRVNGAMLDYLRSLDVLSRANRKLKCRNTSMSIKKSQLMNILQKFLMKTL